MNNPTEPRTMREYLDLVRRDLQALYDRLDVDDLVDSDRAMIREIEEMLTLGEDYLTEYPDRPLGIQEEMKLDPDSQELFDDLFGRPSRASPGGPDQVNPQLVIISTAPQPQSFFRRIFSRRRLPASKTYPVNPTFVKEFLAGRQNSQAVVAIGRQVIARRWPEELENAGRNLLATVEMILNATLTPAAGAANAGGLGAGDAKARVVAPLVAHLLTAQMERLGVTSLADLRQAAAGDLTHRTAPPDWRACCASLELSPEMTKILGGSRQARRSLETACQAAWDFLYQWPLSDD